MFPRFSASSSDSAVTERPLVAVSACLLGHPVRYDGTHKGHLLFEKHILPFVEVLPLCPETGAGLGVPRPPVQLVQFENGVRAIGRDDPALDVTMPLKAFAVRQANALAESPALCGYILKSRSPSCGLMSTPVYDVQGQQIFSGNGLYAETLVTQLPWLVIIEETALDSPLACQFFLQKLFFVKDVFLAASENQLPAAHQHYQRVWQFCDGESLHHVADSGNASHYLSLALADKTITQLSTMNPYISCN